MSIWVLVSDASRAVLYAADERGGDWSVVGSYEHPESRLKNSQLSPSEPGHAAKSKGTARHTVMQPDTPPKEAEFEHFAGQLADALTSGARQHRFEGLVLVAPPHFLGLLRSRLSTEAEKHLIGAVDKDYTALAPSELRNRLEQAVLGPTTS